ncbi:segregation and condensation protein A [Thioalkalivibrio halophilus]|uniref:Segregation and condensation protein A n=1 Tax=Thioalkalivibrio halophilus TaxID=252474 RepID=A0A1V2ZZG9_9GAMM|nr:ScpA family protein [Thioalkalivibrio halophilus]OOC10507.1 segregation/condensation protein A [Thioalkalivibrio halophilus]
MSEHAEDASVDPVDPAAAGEGEHVWRVHGEPVAELPEDLYIPPDALEVFLDSFEGPLDLLLYLIRRQNLDILAIPIAEITRQYMAYIEVMRALRLELAGEYLVMAALLAEIKSRMLLPRPAESGEEDAGDPRMALIRQLQEYEQFKTAAERLDALPRMERDFFAAGAATDALEGPPPPAPSLDALMDALAGVMRRASLNAHHHVATEQLSVRERMTRLLHELDSETFTDFVGLLERAEGRQGVVVSFLAILELAKAGLVEWGQSEPYAPIRLRRRGGDA